MMRPGMLLLILSILLSGCGVLSDDEPVTPTGSDHGPVATGATPIVGLGPLPARVPALPFGDNPDPEACGIPRDWGKEEPGYVSGVYGGDLIQPVVYL